MKILNRDKRIEYLGFNDLWFILIGVLVLSFTTDYLFNDFSFGRLPFFIALIQWSISLFFTVMNWFVIRFIMIQLRKKFPSFRDTLKRIGLFFVALVATVLLVNFFGNLFLSFNLGSSFNNENSFRTIVPVIIISTMTMAIYEAIYYYFRLQLSIREEEQAKQIIVQAQLDALRNQAQPHFLFNSLNTLRDIIDENSKEDAKKFVDQLSNVYRFILESGKANLISLKDEVKFSKSYLHIQSERFGNNLSINWNVLDTELGKMIVPMSLQLLLENAIKHNVISKAKPLTINISVKNDQLVVKNKIQPKSTQLPSTKVGLKNIEKRYLLISNRIPEIFNDGELFKVILPLLKPADQNKMYESIDC